MVMRYNGIEIDRTTRTVRHRERICYFGTSRRNRSWEMLEALVMGGGVSNAQLFWFVYGDDPEGGPLYGPKIFDVQMSRLKSVFNKLDLDLRSTKIAGVRFSELTPKHRF
jgi:hypothetical protein